MATKDDEPKEAWQKTPGRRSLGNFFCGLESLLNTIITLEEEGKHEYHNEGEARDPSGRLKTAFHLSIKMDLLETISTPPAEPARVVPSKTIVEATQQEQ